MRVRTKHLASAVALAAGVIGVDGSRPASADTSWPCQHSTEYFWSDWLSGSEQPKYNVSRFQHRICNTYSTTGITAWQFTASETRASRGCGGTDKWRVRSQHFRFSTFSWETPWSGYLYNDCQIWSFGVVNSLGHRISAVQNASMQAKVHQRCEVGSPLNCASFYAYVSKRLEP